MINIVKAKATNAKLLSAIAKISFIQSHENSASENDMGSYVNEKLNTNIFKEELRNKSNLYHILYFNYRAVGYSKIIFNCENLLAAKKNICKMERLYILKDVFDKKLGKALFEYNKELCRNNAQAGIWLNVWFGNERAINFYKRLGFTIVGTNDFQISKTHSNPNYIMYVEL